jgi:hypothetical protein
VSVFAPEAFHPAGGVHQFLFAGEEGMALGADLHPDLVPGGTGDEFIATGAAHRGFQKFGMNGCFHNSVPPHFSKSIINVNPIFAKSHGKKILLPLSPPEPLPLLSLRRESEGCI